MSYDTDNSLYGRTCNPYDLNRSPGGSSGGEAAVIAACGSYLEEFRNQILKLKLFRI